MLLDIRPTGKIRTDPDGDIGALMRALFKALQNGGLDAAGTRVVFDWIQYKQNFQEPVELRPIEGGNGTTLEIGIDLRRCSGPGIDADAVIGDALLNRDRGHRVYLEPWKPTRESVIWDFNATYWSFLGQWEAVTGRSYASALPGGESDALNVAAARESILELFAVWEHLKARHALPDQLPVLELGVGSGQQARVWLDEFERLDMERGHDYYRRLQYFMGDYSPHLLDVAHSHLAHHANHVSGLVLDAMHPTKTLAFLRYKTFFVYISNVYDNLPTDEVARIGGRNFHVESRAYLSGADGARIAANHGLEPQRLPDLIAKLLRLGPDVLAETYAGVFPSGTDAVKFWQSVWAALRLEERYVPLKPLDEYVITDGTNGAMLRALLEAQGDVRMHVSNGAVSSFVDTLSLLHPHGVIKCHDLFVTNAAEYCSGFRGPGKYDGSVVNWVNGPLLAAVAARQGFDVSFQPFVHRKGSNIITMTAMVRE